VNPWTCGTIEGGFLEGLMGIMLVANTVKGTKQIKKLKMA
jgi:hypothetical protein